MPTHGIDCLIFDLGGTLYKPALDLCGLTREFLGRVEQTGTRTYQDTDILEALKAPDAWLDRYMIENNVDPHWQPSPEHWHEFDRHLLTELGVTDDVEKAAVVYQDIWDEFLRNLKPEIIGGVTEAIEGLIERHFKIGIVSNRFGDPSVFLERDGLLGLVSAVEYSDVPGYRKPSPYMLLRVADTVGTNPRRCAYVGNIVKYDVIAARNAEMTPVLITWCDPDEESDASGDVVVIDHIEKLFDTF
jgi:HAD superfamily hydrolase (TIGR01549 family)